MQTFARKLNLIALALGAALTAPGCATDWFSSSSSDYVAGELSQDVDNLPDPNAPPTPPKRSAIVSPLGAPFKESPDRLLLQANAYFEQGKFHDSSRLYQKYLATSEAATAPPTVLGQAHYRIAVVARKKLNFAEAKREFEIALRYEPQNQQYRFDLGKSAFDGADYATADAAFSALIAQNPNYPQAQYYYGLTLLEGTRRAEAIAPLTKAVGELEAAALLTDKYYALGETENAAAWESQTTQIAARLGRPVPAFPNKPAFASTAQPQNPTQSAPVVQTQNPTQSAPVAQTQNPAQSAPVAQTQGPAQVAPTTQTQDSAQVAPTTQTQDSVQVAPTTQPQGPAQVAPTTQTQGPVQVAPTTQTQGPAQVAPVDQTQAPAQVAPVDQTQGPAQVAPTTQTQGPAPFVATVAPPTSEESVASADVATLESATVDDGESLAQAAPSDELPCQNSAQETDLKTLIVQTDEPVVPSPVLAVQNAESQENSENTQSLTAHIGRRNPGLFASPTKSDSAASTDVKIDFRPGSISTAAPLVAQTIPTTQEPQVAQTILTSQEPQVAQTIPAAQDAQVAQTTPAAQDAQVAQTTPAAQDAQVAQTNPAPQTAQTAPFFGPRFPEASRFDAETSFRLVDRLVELENCVAEYFAPLAPIYETAPSPFPIAEPAELYAVAPSPSDFSIGAEEEFDENDDFAFASSGAPQTPVATSAPATIGGFGSYQAPTFDASPVVPVLTPVQPLAQAAPTTQFPQVAQAAPTTQFPQVAQAAPTTQFLQVAQAVPTAQTPLVAQAVPTAQTPLVAQAAPAAQFPQVAQAAPTTQFPQVAQAVPTAQTPQVAQAVPTAQTPLVAQAAPAAQFPQVAQAAPAAQFPQVAQAAPTAVSQYAAPNAGSRRPTTPEERLQAAIAAGAEVREISPEEYRRAVSVGLNGQAQPR